MDRLDNLDLEDEIDNCPIEDTILHLDLGASALGAPPLKRQPIG